MKPILLTLDTRRAVTQKLELMQGYDYILQCFLNDDGSKTDLEESKIQIELLKADNTFIIQTENIEVGRNKITFEIDKDFLRVAGEGKLQIVATKEGKTFGSWIVDIKVNQRAITDNKGQSQSKVTITEELKNTITEAQEVKGEIIKDISYTGEKEKTELNEVVEKAELKENILKELIEYNEENRVKVWTPSVDPDGNLSWKQAKAETEPPATQNIKGDKGEKGQDGKQGERGLRGDRGEKGKDATINGFNTLKIEKGENIEIKQEDNKLTISATGGSGNADINDDVVSKESTWSSEKIEYFTLKNVETVWAENKGTNLTIKFTKEGYLKEIELFGNTTQSEEDLSDIKHLGEPVEDRQYKIDIISKNGEEGEEYKKTILLPCRLMKVGDVQDRLYWDNKQRQYIVDKNIETILLDGVSQQYEWSYAGHQDTDAEYLIGVKVKKHNWIAKNFATVGVGFTNKLKTKGFTSFGEYGFILLYLPKKEIESEPNPMNIANWFQRNNVLVYYKAKINQQKKTNITEQIFIPTYKGTTNISVKGGIEGEIKAKAPVDLEKTVRTLKEENEKILEGYTELKEFLSVVYSNLSEKGMLEGIPNALI